MHRVIAFCSAMVILAVFWNLKLTGITMAGEAFCGQAEHAHSEACGETCTLSEHIHTAACYSNLEADLETEEIWKASIGDLIPGATTKEKVMLIAQSQLGYTESQLNFQVDANGVRHGITRYGQWYGNPYGDWSSMFAAFCLHYAGVKDVTFNAGAEAFRLEWEAAGNYQSAEAYAPHVGDLLFLNAQAVPTQLRTTVPQPEPAETTPTETIPEETTPEETIPAETTPTETIPTETIPEETVPAETVPEETTPEETIPPETVPAETVPTETTPTETTPTETIPEETIPTETIPTETTAVTPPVYYNSGTGASRVGIITGVFDDAVTVILGDVDGTVAELTYSVTDPAIVGYGLVPENSRHIMKAAAPTGMTTVASTVYYDGSQLSNSANRYVFYIEAGGNYYAIDGSGNAVPVQVDADGTVHVSGDPNRILWTVSWYNNGSWAIQNVATGRHLHPYYNSATDNGITTPGRWGTIMTANNGNLWLSHSAYVGFDWNNMNFRMARNASENSTFRVAVSQPCTIWLDGTNGGIMSLGGSPNTATTATTGAILTLPDQWQAPDKYAYTLKGWYDIVNHKYYAPGDSYTVTGDAVLYADWQASTYDVGQFNNQVADTVSTNHFITTRLFDYGALLNVISQDADVTISASSHSEVWNLLTSGNNPYNGQPNTNFILRDWDQGGEDISYPNGHNDRNNPTDAGTVYPGLYTEAIRDIFFDPDLELPGKTYVGTADHLFQLCLDPAHDHYGYYYYNSEHNAASYNQSDGRFYVYDYLECTIDSYNAGNEGKYSDFLPFNSPYADTNGKTVVTYNYQGVEGEYVGTTHYRYDSRYNDNGNSTANVGTNFWYGMAMDVEFYLPNKPGTLVDGQYGNKDIYGKDMHFRFTGDDDVWILIDGKLVLDLGGLHGCESGDINFATGVVTINGVRHDALTQTLQSLEAGDHTLSLYYMERGSSMSNCAIYFNLAPRFAFSIQKEDALTKDVLNGAEFSVYLDQACTVPAQLWTDKASHERGDTPTNAFTVTDGAANMWGMGAGNTYYIKETRPPDKAGYGLANGIIRLTFDQLGTASYQVEMLDTGSGLSPGFNVHGLRIDAEDQQAYIVATNAPTWAEDATTVTALKRWNDSLSHSADTVTVYLTVPDGKGGILRLQEATLSAANNWTHTWENLPKYLADGTPVPYGVEESYTPGYYTTVEGFTGTFQITQESWQDASWLENGKTYILRDGSGKALSAQRYAEDTGFTWISEDAAKTDPLAQWTASVNGNNVRLTNGSGQTITFWYGNGSPTDFYAYNQQVEDNNRKQYYAMGSRNGGINLSYAGRYIADTFNDAGKFNNTTEWNRSRVFYPATLVSTSQDITVKDQGFLVTNTPLDRETSLTVYKNWSIPADMNASAYERLEVPVRLYANGEDTGRTVTLSLKNGWQAAFRGLPYTDSQGNVIQYTVKETWDSVDWAATYGPITASGGTTPQYSATITNIYRKTGPEMPSTGYAGRLLYILCGSGILLGALVYGMVARRKRERRFI